MTKNLDNEGLQSIAENYDLFYIDLWGVVHNGIKLHEKAIFVLKALLKLNKKFILLTNAPRPNESVKIFLKKMGMDNELRDHVFTSGEASLNYLKRLSDDDMAVSGGCQDWKSYEGGDFEIKILTHRVAKVQIAFAKLNENNLEVEETHEMSCANQFTASKIVNHLAQNANGIREPVTCDGNIWRVISCRDTSGFSVPAICVNCSESEISGVCSALTSDDEVCSIGDNSVLIAPCSQSVCAKRSRKSLAKVFKTQY